MSKPNTSKICFLFDGDLLVYRAGFSAEKRKYTVESSTSQCHEFSNIKDAKLYCNLHSIHYSNITWERHPDPEPIAVNNMNKLIEGTYNSFNAASALKWGTTVDDHCSIFFLTGCDKVPNFRDIISNEYKANRDPAHKPMHLAALRQELIDNHSTVITQGAETDDYLAQAAKDAYLKFPDMLPVIVSLDKDLLTVPGVHYNFKSKEIKLIENEEGTYNFFIQMLVGDTADNIRGIKGMGPKKSEKLLKGHTLEEMRQKVWQTYQTEFGEDAKHMWNLNCQLLWIWRKVPDECPYLITPK